MVRNEYCLHKSFLSRIYLRFLSSFTTFSPLPASFHVNVTSKTWVGYSRMNFNPRLSMKVRFHLASPGEGDGVNWRSISILEIWCTIDKERYQFTEQQSNRGNLDQWTTISAEIEFSMSLKIQLFIERRARQHSIQSPLERAPIFTAHSLPSN
jgi:hypothetical protein